MKPEVLQRLCDKPVLEKVAAAKKTMPDLLNHQKVADNVLKMIVESEKTEESPCIAIFGPWGTGKTGILNLVGRKLGRDQYVWHCTDAWHNQRNDLVILEILEGLCAQAGPDLQDVFLRLIWAVAGIATGPALEALLPNKEVASKLPEAINKILKENRSLSREQIIKREFKKLVEHLTNNGKKRLVIAIDNLDRCRPDAALQVLETLFLITHVGNCAFIVAADQQVLVSFLNREYRGTEFSGTKYLEKIFPYYFRVPDPWVAWSHETAESNEDEVLALLEYLIPETNPWRKDEDTFKMVWHYFSQTRALRNPRRIKRILRRVLDYEFDGADLTAVGRPELSQNLLFLVILSDLWPQVYEYFMTVGQTQWRTWLEFMASRDGTPPTSGVLTEDADLRDFLYLVKKYNDDSFDDTSIGSQKELWDYLADIAELGL